MRTALEGLKAVRRAEVDLATGQAKVETSGEPLSDRQLIETVEGQIIATKLRRFMASLGFGSSAVRHDS